jgi:hypothetical protein
MIKKLLFQRFNIIIVFAITISIFAAWHWFSGNYILYYWDAFVPLNSNNSSDHLFYSWRERIFPGAPGAVWVWFIYVFSINFLNNFLSSVSLAQGIIYITLIFFSIVNFYLLIIFIVKTTFLKIGKLVYLTSFVFSALYALNLYTFYSAYFMFNPEAYILAFFPLNILALLHIFPMDNIRKIKNQKYWTCIFFISLFLMSSGFATYIFFFQYLIWIFMFLIFSFLQSKENYIKKFLNYSLFFFLIILANLWWFFPFFINIQSYYESARFTTDTTAFIESSSKNGNLLNSLRLIGGPVMDTNRFSWTHFYLDKNIFNFTLFFFPLLIIFLFLRIKLLARKSILILIFIMFLVSLFLVKLGNPPFANLTFFAFKYIPFFDAFRNAYQKAGLYYMFSYFILSSMGFNLLISILIKKRSKILIYISYFLLFLCAIVMTGPFFLFRTDNVIKINDINNNKKIIFSAKTQIPKEYYDLKNILEENCINKTTIVIPRGAAITNATWEKYGTNYIGQDILSHFVNCNLISVKIGENNPDAFATAPYLLLQDNDFASFRNFLFQNNIALVLIRKDNIPSYYTNWFYVSPQETIVDIEKDNDFIKIYDSDFFNLYKINDNSLDAFGFDLPQNIIYTNSLFSTSFDYAMTSRAIGYSSSNLIINNNVNFKKYSDFINQYIPVGNCVGCVKVLVKPIEAELTLKQKIKPYLLPILTLIRSEQKFSYDEKISYAIIANNNVFNELLTKLLKEDSSSIDSLANIYNFNLFEIRDLILNYNKLNLDKNNKLIEYKNFISGQRDTLLRYINDGKIKDYQAKIYLYELLLNQKNELDFINEKIWETDFVKKIYNVRLDIPEDGDYRCSLNIADNDISIKNISIGNDLKNFEEISTQSGALKTFNKGSYSISIKYDTKQVVNEKFLNIQDKKIINLANLKNGKYNISFDFSDYTSQKILLIISSNNDLSNSSINRITDRVIFTELINNKNDRYTKSFYLDSLESKNYYLHIIAIKNDLDENAKEINISNLKIEKEIESDEINFYCILKLEKNQLDLKKITVNKINPTKYVAILPENFKGFLTFNQTYNDDWQAYSYINGKKYIYDHFKNAYANGWYIDNYKNGKIFIEFTRQKLIERNAIVTFFAFILLFIIYMKLKNKNE